MGYYAIHEDKGKSLPQTTAKPLFIMASVEDGLGPLSFWYDFDPIRTVTESLKMSLCVSTFLVHICSDLRASSQGEIGWLRQVYNFSLLLSNKCNEPLF